jgi:hypothetical protein
MPMPAAMAGIVVWVFVTRVFDIDDARRMHAATSA